MARLTLSFLGTFQATLDQQRITNFRSAKVQGLLVYLAMQAERPFPRDVLATLFWPKDDDSTARRNLRQTLYQLRQLLQDADDKSEPFLLVTRHTAQFNSASDYSLDVHELLTGLATGDLATAVAHYTAELLPGFTCDSLDFEEWLRGERERLHRLALEAMSDLAERHLAQADFVAAQAIARRQLALESWREVAHRQLMQALASIGDRSAALAQYQSCTAILANELGIEPSPETTAVYQAILSGQYTNNSYAASTSLPQIERKTLTQMAYRQAQRILLDKVHTFWVEGVLQQAMVNGRLLDIELETVPEAVANPWQDVVPRFEIPHQPIPPGTSMMNLFEENSRSLLILGLPGSGKTVALLQLAQSLIALARQDESEPIPVVFNLSSWAHETKPLAQWLADELNEKYLIPKKIGQSWLAEDRLLLLLDGLDEVETSKQTDCVTAVPARQWLTWLAQKMSTRNQTVFLVEGIQPDWLTAGWQRWLYLLITRLLLGLIVGLILWIFGLAGRQIGVTDHSQSSLLLAAHITWPLVWIDLFMSLLIHALYGLLVTAVDLIFYEKRHTNLTTPSDWDWRRKIATTLVVGLTAYIQLRLFDEQPVLLVLQVWTSAFMFVLVAHFAFGRGYHDDVGTVEALSWSGQASSRGLLPSLLIGFLFSLVVWQLIPTERTLAQIILLIGIPITLLVLSLFGLTNSQIQTKIRPNQGILLSAKNSFMGGG